MPRPLLLEGRKAKLRTIPCELANASRQSVKVGVHSSNKNVLREPGLSYPAVIGRRSMAAATRLLQRRA